MKLDSVQRSKVFSFNMTTMDSWGEGTFVESGILGWLVGSLVADI